jgi:hypothetical protein
MGLEAKCRCRWNGESREVKALLEAHELILRGDIKQRFALADLRDISASGDDLHFSTAAGAFALELGAEQARRWAKKIAAPPPSLAAKLGIKATLKVMAIGALDDGALKEALKDAIAARREEAHMTLAVVHDAPALSDALAAHEALPTGTPIWIVYEKGRKAAFGEGPVRKFIRAAGYRDSKVAGVSDALSATRYARSGGDGSA